MDPFKDTAESKGKGIKKKKRQGSYGKKIRSHIMIALQLDFCIPELSHQLTGSN